MSPDSTDGLGFDVLYEDGPLLVINKPAGISTQAPPGIDSLEVKVKRWLETHDPKPGKPYLGVPQRLDRPVSGAIVFATRRRAAHRLSKQFEQRKIGKVYWACTEGIVDPPDGTWIDWVRKVEGEARAEIVSEVTPGAKRAELEYITLGMSAVGSCLEIRLKTGRMHQIRIQSAHRGTPVVGDSMYGAQSEFGEPVEDWRARPIALHARRIEFDHTVTRDRVSIEAPLNERWLTLGDETPFASQVSPNI